MAEPDDPATPSDSAVPDDVAVEQILEQLIGRPPRRGAPDAQFRSLVRTLWSLAHDDVHLGDLKIADAALGEMAEAFAKFRPFRSVRKVTMFGSARTQPDQPVYVLARDLAVELANAGWMVVTGAGPGIMAAGSEGAGADHAFGVNIRLPFESGANAFIARDAQLVEMRYFFTRKLMLIKESHGYAVLPGGVGTQDECFELLTLLQTGRAEPAPVVLVETEGGTYWKAWTRFVVEEAIGQGYMSPEDMALFTVANTVDDAAKAILDFYRNYHSCRWVGDLLVLRLEQAPSHRELKRLNEEFADIVAGGRIRKIDPLPPERTSDDHLDLPRLALRFDKYRYGRLRQLIDALNACDSAQ